MAMNFILAEAWNAAEALQNYRVKRPDVYILVY
jgi:hypothetical protein